MTTKNILVLLVVAMTAPITACKLELDVPEGGRIVSESGAHTCGAHDLCVIDVYDLFFDETFIAQPAPGYEFAGWRGGYARLCGDRTGPCHLATAGFAGNEHLLAILQSEQSFYLEPEFRPVLDPQYHLEYRETDAPRIIDANGRIIGSLASTGPHWDIHVNFRGLPDTYTLTIVEIADAFMFTPDVGPRTDIAYLGEDSWNHCQPLEEPAAIVDAQSDDTRRVYMRGPFENYIPAPGGEAFTGIVQTTWSSFGLSCQRTAFRTTDRNLLPLAATDLSFEFPLTVEGTELEINQHPDLVI